MGIAQAGLFEDDEARKAILDLRQRVEQSNATIKLLTQENAQLRRALFDFQGQIDSLKSELSQSRGAQEQLTRTQAELARSQAELARSQAELARALSEFQIRQKDLVLGVEDRLRRFDPVKVNLDGAEFMAEPAEKRDFDAAMETFRKGDFATAQLALDSFIKRYRTSGYAASALFWLGNAQYANKDYKESMANFQLMLKSSPAHPRAPEAMLAVSNVQIELKDLKGARKTLDELVKAYPASETAATARERLARLR
jgi:tol-pal system protein YbgF